MAKWIHMPDQDEVKSGQRFADGMLWFAGALMAVTGVILMLGSTVVNLGTGYGVVLFLHDLGFLLIAVFGLAHIFLGGWGILQAQYRGTYDLYVRRRPGVRSRRSGTTGVTGRAKS